MDTETDKGVALLEAGVPTGDTILEPGDKGECLTDLMPFLAFTYSLTVADPKAALFTRTSTPLSPAHTFTTFLNFKTDSCSPWSRKTALVFLCSF